jgi:hypothetical protein
LVLSEGPKNAPDSFGGKLEEKGVFKLLIDEIINKLETAYGADLNYEKIGLYGHSGGYRVIAYILLHGGLTAEINEVILFDGLYADVEKYSYWLDNYNGKLINIYTPNGGTKSESENLMLCLTSWGIQFTLIENDYFSVDQLKENRIIFIASSLGHNDVISKRNQFEKFLRSGE